MQSHHRNGQDTTLYPQHTLQRLPPLLSVHQPRHRNRTLSARLARTLVSPVRLFAAAVGVPPTLDSSIALIRAAEYGPAGSICRPT